MESTTGQKRFSKEQIETLKDFYFKHQDEKWYAKARQDDLKDLMEKTSLTEKQVYIYCKNKKSRDKKRELRRSQTANASTASSQSTSVSNSPRNSQGGAFSILHPVAKKQKSTPDATTAASLAGNPLVGAPLLYPNASGMPLNAYGAANSNNAALAALMNQQLMLNPLYCMLLQQNALAQQAQLVMAQLSKNGTTTPAANTSAGLATATSAATTSVTEAAATTAKIAAAVESASTTSGVATATSPSTETAATASKLGSPQMTEGTVITPVATRPLQGKIIQ